MTAHALAEEDVIYPVPHDDAHAVDDANQLYSEHAQMKINAPLPASPTGPSTTSPKASPCSTLPEPHRRRLRTANPIERAIQQEIKRRTSKVRGK